MTTPCPSCSRRTVSHSHLTSDHGHYWEDGGCTYHTRYSTWECHRGQEGDPWKPVAGEVEVPEHLGQLWRQDVVNRSYMKTEADPSLRAKPSALAWSFWM